MNGGTALAFNAELKARPKGQTMTNHDVPVARPLDEDKDAERPERSVAEQLVDQHARRELTSSALAGC